MKEKKDRSIVRSLFPIALLHNFIFIDARDEAMKEIFRPLAPEMMRKNDLLKQLAELPEEDLAAILEEYRRKKQS